MYSSEKVAFSQDEHDAARAADEIYETLQKALSDGLQISDLSVIPTLLSPTTKLYTWLGSGDRAEFASKLITLGLQLKRDNDW